VPAIAVIISPHQGKPFTERQMSGTNLPVSPVKYAASAEFPEQDEAQVDADIVATMRQISEITLANGGAPLRSVHAKSHGLLHGQLTVAAGLPEVLAQGLFAKAAAYPVIMRLSTTPGDILEDSVSTPRGLAVKVIGVEGPRVDGSEADTTQDFVLVNGPAFNAPNAGAFLKTIKLLAPTTDKSEHLKKLTSTVARGAEAVVEAVGGKSATLVSLGGQQEHHILGETFYSQTPILYGAYIAKIAIFPTSPSLTALTRKPLTNNGEANMLRNVVVDYFRAHDASWDVRVQLCTDLAKMPVEDASVVWDESESPYLTVATITAGRQDAWTIEKIAAIDEGLSFTPWHALAAHRPLGSVNRARKSAYEMSAKFRAENSRRVIAEPRSLEDVL
jgi:hypothetical protein